MIFETWTLTKSLTNADEGVITMAPLFSSKIEVKNENYEIIISSPSLLPKVTENAVCVSSGSIFLTFNLCMT